MADGLTAPTLCQALVLRGRIEFCPEGACIPRGEALGTVGTQRKRNQPRLLVGKRLKEGFLEEVMPEFDFRKGS